MLPGQHLQIVTLIFVYQQVHLEHIPKDSIKKIFIELRRILKKDGVVCATIDYTDHYAHTDKNIGLLNFLSYSDEEWKKYNHNCNYQNRLRHYDYETLFSELMFKIVNNEPAFFKDAVFPSHIDSKFKLENPLYKATSGYFVLKNC